MGIVTENDDSETDNEAPVIEEDKIDVKVDSDDDKTPVDKPKADAGDRPSRKERREAKKYDFQSELRQRDAEIARLRADSETRAREFAELRGRFEERHAKDSQNAHEEKFQELEDKANSHLAAAHAAGQAGDQPRAAREMKAYYATLREMHREDAKAAQQAQQSQQEQPAWTQIPEETQEDIMRIFDEFPWMKTRANARQATDLLINDMVKQGHPNNYVTFRAAATTIANTYRIGGSAPPSDSQRRRYTGVGSGDGDGGTTAPRTVRMGDHERAMARAWGQTKYPGIGEEESYTRWAREVGAKIQQGR